MKELLVSVFLFIVLSQIGCGSANDKKLEQFVKNWQTAQNNYDTKALKGMYAPLVFYFGKNREIDKVLKSKMKYFGGNSDYEESIQSDLEISNEGNNLYSCTFRRRVIYKKRVTEANFCLVIKNTNNDFKVVEELDAITCKNTNPSNFPADAIAPSYMCGDNSSIPPTSAAAIKVDQRGNQLFLLENNKEVLLSSKLGCEAIQNNEYIAWWEGIPDEYYHLKVYSFKDKKTKKIKEERNIVWVEVSSFSANGKFLYACYNDAGTRGSIQGCYAINLETNKEVGSVLGCSVTPNPKDQNSVLVYEDQDCGLCGGYERYEYIYDLTLKKGKHNATFDTCDTDCDY